MFAMFEDPNFKQNAGVSQALQQFASHKPYLSFNNDLQVCDCNDLFVSIFRIEREELLATDLAKHNQNIQFLQAVRKAQSEGIATFHGKLHLGIRLSGVYLEALLLNFISGSPDQTGVSCYILENVFQDDENNPALQSIGSGTELPGYFNASVSVHKPDGSAIYISPSTELMLGYSCAEIKELGSPNLVYSDDLPAVKNAIEKLNSGLDFLTLRYRMIHKNGSIVFVETTSYILGDASGIKKHLVNITWDLGNQQGMKLALQVSEQKYYRLVMNLPVGVTLISANGKLLEVNEAMKKIMHIPSRISISELNFLHIDSITRSGISKQFSRCIETKEIVQGEAQINLSRKAPLSYLSYSFVPILNISGEVEFVLGYVDDLTQQKKAENDIRERADFLNLVINALKNPFFVKDEKHRWVMLNDAAVNMMGHSREYLLGKSDYDLYPEQQANVFWQYDKLVLESGNSSNEEQITWSDGTFHTIVTHKQLYVEKPSGKKFIVGTIHDVTSYKKNEEELRVSEKKYHELFDNANDFILTIDIEGNITNANRTLLNYLKTDLESFTRHNVFEFITEEKKELVRAIKEKLFSGIPESSFEINANNIEGQTAIYEVKASIINQDGKIVGVQCIFSDVTSRREASNKLEKYNKDLLELNTTKDKFFSIIAHDLRNPYSSIIGFAEMLLEDLDELSKDNIKESLKIIHVSAKNSFNLLENLLAWSRLETGHMKFTPGKVVLLDAVEEVVNVLFSLAYRKKIEINNLVYPDVVLFADINMLNTILNNLLMNAIKYTHAGGEVNIFSAPYTSEPELPKDYVKISVADTGIGMDAETREKLFSSNRMVSNPGTDREQGTGLGLLLTRDMVEKHGGEIMVESSPGEGSVFSFLIPAYKPKSNS